MIGFLPADKEHLMQSHCFECAAGMGVAGNGHCFLGGDPELEKCDEFIEESEFLMKEEKRINGICS